LLYPFHLDLLRLFLYLWDYIIESIDLIALVGVAELLILAQTNIYLLQEVQVQEMEILLEIFLLISLGVPFQNMKQHLQEHDRNCFFVFVLFQIPLPYILFATTLN